jgi:hypothetical protein
MTSARRSLTLLLTSALVSVPASAAPYYFYAIGSNNHLYEVSDAGVRQDVRDLSGLGATGLVNGAAFDAAGRDFFFAVPGATSASFDLWYWNQATNAAPVKLGSPQTAKPDNGAFWGGAYWYVEQGTTNLHRIPITYDGSGNPDGLGVRSSTTLNYIVNGNTSSPATVTGNDRYFGDIAIQTLGGGARLFGATAYGNQFFSVDLTAGALSTPLYASVIGTVGTPVVERMQLSFDPSGTTLYGHTFSSTGWSSGQWFTINTGSGAVSPIASFITLTADTSNGFQDIGGVSAFAFGTPSSGVPERGPWLALLSVTLVSLVLARRRR